jgi:hypothetical protein
VATVLDRPDPIPIPCGRGDPAEQLQVLGVRAATVHWSTCRPTWSTATTVWGPCTGQCRTPPAGLLQACHLGSVVGLAALGGHPEEGPAGSHTSVEAIAMLLCSHAGQPQHHRERHNPCRSARWRHDDEDSAHRRAAPNHRLGHHSPTLSYDYPSRRRALHRRGITPRIARRQVESSTRLGRHRWKVERVRHEAP